MRDERAGKGESTDHQRGCTLSEIHEKHLHVTSEVFKNGTYATTQPGTAYISTGLLSMGGAFGIAMLLTIPMSVIMVGGGKRSRRLKKVAYGSHAPT
jgi:hypothetical protein